MLKENKPEYIAAALKICEANFLSHDLESLDWNSRVMIEKELNWEMVAAKWTNEAYEPPHQTFPALT